MVIVYNDNRETTYLVIRWVDEGAELKFGRTIKEFRMVKYIANSVLKEARLITVLAWKLLTSSIEEELKIDPKGFHEQ